jgi:hypothetical protein
VVTGARGAVRELVERILPAGEGQYRLGSAASACADDIGGRVVTLVACSLGRENTYT